MQPLIERMLKNLKILVTGSAGFIGHHLVLALAKLADNVVGLDNINSYYDPVLKYDRLSLQGFERNYIRYGSLLRNNIRPNLSFIQLDLTDEKILNDFFWQQQFDIVINLAAQAGVRFSMEHPQSYVASNLVGFANLLETCRKYKIKHLLFASSSSVYGINNDVPFTTNHSTDFPISFYAATKKANEVMAHSYAHLYDIPITGLRFFTVYGPWGRPDMAYYSFAKSIIEGSPIKIFNNGNMCRDFTFINDAVDSIIKLIGTIPKQSVSSSASRAPFKIFNIGNSKPEHLLHLVETLEQLLQKKAVLDLQPMQPGDVESTFAEITDLAEAIGPIPHTCLEVGLISFVKWYKKYKVI